MKLPPPPLLRPNTPQILRARFSAGKRLEIRLGSFVLSYVGDLVGN